MPDRCRASSAQTRHSRPDSGLVLSHSQIKVIKTFHVVLFVFNSNGLCTLVFHPCTIHPRGLAPPEREFFIENLLVRIHLIIVMIRWTGLAPWQFEFPFSGSLISTLHLHPLNPSSGTAADVGCSRRNLIRMSIHDECSG